MIGNLEFKNGKIIGATLSKFQPPQPVKDITLLVKQDYTTGNEIMYTSYEEFNDETVLSRMDLDQSAWNSYTQSPSLDPDESWRWNGVRPLTRNKIIGIAARLTARIIYPNIFAQNNQDEEDKDGANVMRDMVEWNIRNSDYEMDFLFGVISALVNPAVIFEVEFAQALQKIRLRNERGELTIKEVIDEVFSGLQTHIVPVEELFITNIREFNIQRQKAILRRRFIEKDEAKGRYGNHENWDLVRTGVRTLLSEEDGMFYDQKDDQLVNLVEEVIYYNRQEDMEIPFVNGIYFGNVEGEIKDAVENNPFKHRRTLIDPTGELITVPIYRFVKSGWEPIDEKRFFYFKSAVFKLENDQILIDTMWRMEMDGTFLQIMPPIITTGGESVSSNIIYPGQQTNLKDTGTANPLQIGNLQAGYQALQAIEASATESSQSNERVGISEPGEKTLGQFSREERNAAIQLGLGGKMIARLVVDLGYLMIDDIIMHQTIGQVREITGGNTELKFPAFILDNQIEKGKKVTKKIEFTDEFMGRKFTEKELKEQKRAILKKEGGIESDSRLIKVNPFKFSRLRFILVVDADSLKPRNEELEKALNLEAWDRMIQSPFGDREAIDRDFLFETFAQGESNKYMKKAEQVLGAPLTPPGVGKDLTKELTGAKGLKNLLE
jgi:hypothetical protein